MNIRLLILILFASLSNFSQQDNLLSQTIFFINDSALVHVNGNANFRGPNSLLQNNGNIHCRNSNNLASIEFEDSSTAQGNGNYKLQGNWINSASFIADSSHVFLDGNNQLISGDSISTFHILETDSSGIKTQTLDAIVNQQLILNHLELATDSNTLFVFNASQNAVINSQSFGNEGMVSSLGKGALVRSMDSIRTYKFPLGSSIGTRRYRPIEITPTSIDQNSFAASLINHSSNIDGKNTSLHDSSICLVNDYFYHKIAHREGVSDVGLKIYYSEVSDGYYNESTQWNTPTSSLWNATLGDYYLGVNYSFIETMNWSNFMDSSFALARIKPLGPMINGPELICDTTLFTVFGIEDSNSQNEYIWSLPDGALINAGQGTNEINTTWSNNTFDSIAVYQIDSMGCESFPSFLNVSVADINSSFDTLFGNLIGQVNFNNISTGSDSYSWDFGDGNSSFDENPLHNYVDAGVFQVILTAENNIGCVDTSTIWLEILPGISIPNVFTPNADGSNDYFLINAVGMTNQELLIFNRWGQEIYRSTEIPAKWSGENLKNGKMVPEGTYYYLYKASNNVRIYEYNGPLLLLR